MFSRSLTLRSVSSRFPSRRLSSGSGSGSGSGDGNDRGRGPFATQDQPWPLPPPSVESPPEPTKLEKVIEATKIRIDDLTNFGFGLDEKITKLDEKMINETDPEAQRDLQEKILSLMQKKEDNDKELNKATDMFAILTANQD